MKILFVCSGNVSRSFLAEILLTHELVQLQRDDVHISSAGLLAYPGSPADRQMVDFLLSWGIRAEEHKSRQVTKEDMEQADHILVMERAHAEMIERLWPEATPKVELLGKYIPGSGEGDDIPDPYGSSPYRYRLAQSQISMAVKNLARVIASKRE